MSSEKYLNNGAQEYPPKIKHEDLLEKIAEIESVLKTFDELENKTSDELNEIKILKTEVSRLKLIAEQSKEDYEDLDFEPTNLYIETAKQIIEAKKINNKTEYEHIPDTKQFEKYKKYFSKNPQNFLEVNSSNAVDEIEKFNAKITRQFHPDLIGESKPNWRLERAIATQAIYRVNVATKKLIDEKDVFFNNTWEKIEAKREAKRETREINKEWLKEDEAEIKIIFDFFTNFSSENTHFLYIVNDLKDILEVFSLAVDDEVYIKDNEKTDIIIYQKLKRGEKLNEGERSTTLDYIQKMIKIKDIIERVQILQNQQDQIRPNLE